MAVKLSVTDAGFSYDSGAPVWEHLSLQVEEGECLCLLGPNGCGKTTLFRCLSGSLPLERGEVLVNGKNLRDYHVTELAKVLGIVFQEHSAPFPYSSLEVVRMGRAPHLGFLGKPAKQDTELAYSIMEELGIAHLAGKSYTQISGGERQLVLIARTLCQEPEIILFDEPTSHLDFKNQALVLQIIKRLSQKGMTILLTSHYPNHVWKIGTTAALLGIGGMVAQGPVDAVMTEQNLSEAYGVPVTIYDAESGGRKTRFCDPNFESEQEDIQ